MQAVLKTTTILQPQSSKNDIKFASSNRKNSYEMVFGLVCQNIFGTHFFLYINDLPLSISNCNTDTCMYADDSTIHITGVNISDIQTKVQEDLNRIELWCKGNNMFINCNKSKCITVGTKQKLAFQNKELYWTINSEQLQHSDCEKLLGIKIDSNLN